MAEAGREERLMSRALALAAKGLWGTDPNPRVGCVIARDEEIVGEGWHERAGGPHAEVGALAAAGAQARGATAYVTLEPCCHQGRTPPCTEALLAAGIARVVYAAADPDPRVQGRGAARLQAAGVEVTQGPGADAARDLNRGFHSRLERGRPWLRLKLAVSLDGRTALAGGESRWISGEASRADVQAWRARSSAILTGAGTVRQDDPRLDVRLEGADRQPLRVVLDPRFGLPPGSRILAPPGTVLVAGTEASSEGEARLRAAGAETLCLPAAATGGVDLLALLAELARREVNEMQAECGPVLAGSLLKEGLVDELLLYIAPLLLGPDARPLAQLPSLARMQDRLGFRIMEMTAMGEDVRLVLRMAGG